MPLDPAAAGLLQQMEAAGMPPLNEMSPTEARQAAAAFAELGGEGEATSDITDTTIPGAGGEMPARIYTPAGADGGPLPCLLYVHGGGWVIGDIAGTDSICRAVANRARCKVVAFEYRLSPEHKYPAPLDDCYAALRWLAENAASIGVDPERLAVGGDSAGGNLSAAVALRARDEGGPPLRFQLLVYPVTDHRFDTESYRENGEGYLLTTDTMRWFWDHYVNGPSDSESPYVSPLRAKDLSGLPPAMVITAEYDPLRDEGEAFVAKLREAGVPVTLRRFDGQIHGFWQMMGVFPAAKEAAEVAAEELRRAFAGTASASA